MLLTLQNTPFTLKIQANSHASSSYLQLASRICKINATHAYANALIKPESLNPHMWVMGGGALYKRSQLINIFKILLVNLTLTSCIANVIKKQLHSFY